jgi:hypothetical protein
MSTSDETDGGVTIAGVECAGPILDGPTATWPE